MDAQPLSEIEFARLKASRPRSPSAWQHVAAEWQRPSDSWQQTLRWTALALGDEWRRWQVVLPGLVRGDFIFTLALWVAVFSVAAAVVAQPSIPLAVRYSTGLAAVAYLYLYTELARIRRPVPGHRFLLGAADVAVVVALGALSAPYVGYAHVLLFFAALRLAARFPDARVVLIGLLMLLPFEFAGQAALLTVLLDTFAVVMTMLLVVQLTTMTATAEGAIQRQSAIAQLTSSLARVRDEEALFAQLASQAPALGTNCAWAFWTREGSGDQFRPVRWAGLPEGELPVFAFTPALGADAADAVLINGPLPGTSVGDCTLLQPTGGDGLVNGLITLAGRRQQFDAATRLLARQVAEEMGATLLRLQTLDEQRQRTDAMEQANRLAGLAARYAADQAAALGAVLPAVAETLRSESLHLEWVHGDRLELVVGMDDPLQGHTPGWLSLAGTRAADAVQQGQPVREPVTGRRPEDLCLVPAGLRQIAVVPLQCAGIQGTLQLSRRLPRPYSAGELLVLQLLADRLGLLFAAGVDESVANSGSMGVQR
ncbi:MAG TPA: hypothetical protein VFR68_14330 [Candidatus Dormibacteraeota bacterium]|nr:hypothetical protein [Candidatus Dormibacteraeota bacterium]